MLGDPFTVVSVGGMPGDVRHGSVLPAIIQNSRGNVRMQVNSIELHNLADRVSANNV
jgi:hypothetical protein